MWLIIQCCFFITLLGVYTPSFAQNHNTPYELGDTVIVKDLADKAYQSFRLENGAKEAGKIYAHTLDMIQCIHEQYPQDHQAFRLYYESIEWYYYHSLEGDTTGLYSTENRKKLGLELSRRFGEYSRPMHEFYQHQSYLAAKAGRKKEAINYMFKDYYIRKEIYPSCHPQQGAAYSLGDLYQRLNMPDSAIFWFKKAAEWSKHEMGASYSTEPNSYLRIGAIFSLSLSENDSAIYYYTKSLNNFRNNFHDEMHQIQSIQWLYHGLSQIILLSAKHNLTSKRKLFEEYITFVKQINQKNIFYDLLSNTYRYFAIALSQSDSLNESIQQCHIGLDYSINPKYQNNPLGITHRASARKYYIYTHLFHLYSIKNQDELSMLYLNYAMNALNDVLIRQKILEGHRYFKLFGYEKKINPDKALSFLRQYRLCDSLFKIIFEENKRSYEFKRSNCHYTLVNLVLPQQLGYKNNNYSEMVGNIISFLKEDKNYTIDHLNNILQTFNSLKININPIANEIFSKNRNTINSQHAQSKLFLLLSINYQTYHPDSSLLFIQESVKRLVNDTTLQHVSQNARITQINPVYYPHYAAIQLQKAQLLYALPATDPRRQYVDSSLTLAEQVADVALTQLKNSYDRVDFLATLRKIIEMRLHAELEKGQPHSAYEAIERNRARMLFLHYAEQKANQLNQIPPADRFALDSLTTLISDTDIKLSLLRAKSKPTPEEETALQSLTRRKIACEEMRLGILQKIESNIPEYVEGLKEKPSFDVEKFRQTFFTRPENTNKAVLEYFQTEDSLYMFCLTGLGLKMKSNAISDSLMNAQADAFTATMADSFPKFLRLRQPKKSADTFKQYVKQGTDLYHRLVAPFAEEIKGKDLIIVPDGAIWKIPMEALLAIRSDKERDSLLNLYESLEENAYKFLPYLVQDHSIERRLSLTFETNEPEQKIDYKYDLVAFAPVFEDKGKKTGVSPSSVARSFLNGIRFHASRSFAVRSDASGESMTITPLPESKNEVHKIAGLIAKSSKNPLSVKVFLQNEATESQFKTLQNQPIKYLHIATHGFANINQPNLSGLIFTPEKTLKEDGILYAGEIQSMKYPSYLVTLSACETGRGKVISGEGILGLMYGFMQSGTENVVSSYWTVNDRATSQMMSDLYSRLQTGQVPTHALRSSQKQMIIGGYASPYFWASFSTYKLKSRFTSY